MVDNITNRYANIIEKKFYKKEKELVETDVENELRNEDIIDIRKNDVQNSANEQSQVVENQENVVERATAENVSDDVKEIDNELIRSATATYKQVDLLDNEPGLDILA